MIEQTLLGAALEKPKPTSAAGNVCADKTKMAGPPWPRTILWRASNGTVKELCCIRHLRDCFVHVLHTICYRCLLQFVHTCFFGSSTTIGSQHVMLQYYYRLSNIFRIVILLMCCREHEMKVSFEQGLKWSAEKLL